MSGTFATMRVRPLRAESLREGRVSTVVATRHHGVP